MPLKRRVATKEKPPSGGMLALIDADIILYSASADKTFYTCCGSVPFQYKKDMVNYCHDMNLPMEFIEKTITPEPLSFCLHTIKSMIKNIMDKTGASSYRGFLTGKGNYREDIDSRCPYKGQRSPDKPTHFYAARDYLITQYGAETIDGAEADDAMGWNQTDNTIILTLDKDLDQIKGKHFNWTKDKLYEVTQDEADRFLYHQILTGDNVDNIKGIKGVGPKTAEKLLQDAATIEEMYTICLEQYEQAGMDYYDLLENGNLLWIQRSPNQHWLPPL